ncbi:MAG: hypothetical protein U9Q71_02070 [Pseudomonadota bacterium]|nr:hypothetical protein [Pseudomonadota bacterium]
MVGIRSDKQSQNIFWITRLACYASLQGKAIDFVNEVSYLIWSGVVHPTNPSAADDPAKGHWPNFVKEYMKGYQAHSCQNLRFETNYAEVVDRY